MSSRLAQDQPQVSEYGAYEKQRRAAEQYRQEKKLADEDEKRYQEELKKYNEDLANQEKIAQEYNLSTTLPRDQQIINVAIREKETGKLVAVYSTSRGGRGSMIPESISLQFGGVSKEEIEKRKKNPNYKGVGADPTKYTTEKIVFGNQYYDYEVKAGLPQKERVVTEAKIVSLESEIRSGGAKDFIYHGGDYEKYNAMIQNRITASKNITFGGKDQKQVDWSRLSKEELKTELEKQKQVAESKKTLTPPEIWTQSREYARQRAAGVSTTGITITNEQGVPIQPPRQMSREQTTAYNREIIESQKQILYPQMYKQNEGIPKSIPDTYLGIKEGKGTTEQPFKGKQPDRNLISPYLGATYWTAPGTEKTFTTKSDAEAFLNKGAQMQWTVGDKTFATESEANEWIGRTVVYGDTQRTFKTKEGAEKFRESLPKSFIGYSPSGKPIQGAVQPLWTVENLNPITKERFPTRTFKTEGEAIAYQKKFGKEEKFTGLVGNDFFAEDKYVGSKPSLVAIAMEPKQTWLGAEIEREYNVVSKEAEELQKKDPLKAALFGIPYATQRSVLGTMAFGVNYAEQVYAPFLAEKVGIKVERPAPINLKSDTSGITVLPYQFEKGRFDYSSKEWASRQAQYIKKYGVAEYGAGLVFDFGGMTGVPKAVLSGTVRVGGKIISPLLPRIGRTAREAALLQSTGKIGKATPRFSSPSKTWDIAEKTSPVGFRKTTRPTLPIPTKPTTVKKGAEPQPNPYGKERRIPYAVRQGAIKVTDYIKSIPPKISATLPPRPQTPNVLLRAGVIASRVIDAEQARLRKTRESFNRWNEAGRIESPIPQGTKIRNTRLERMRNLMWPDEPILPSKPRTLSPFEKKVRARAELFAIRTKQNIKDNFKVLNNMDKDLGGKITNPILKAIKKDQKIPTRSVSQIHFGKKTQLPKLEGMTVPEGFGKFVQKADVSIFATRQKAKIKIKQAKEQLSKEFSLMRKIISTPEAKKELIPFKTKQELKNMTREDRAKETQDFLDSMKLEKTSSREFVEEFRDIMKETRLTKKREYSITPKRHQDYLKGETLVNKIQKSSKRQVQARRAPTIELSERKLIPRLKYKETKLIDKILSGLGKPEEFKGEYMPRSKGKSKPNRNIFIEDRAKETQDFLESMKSEKTTSREFAEEFREPNEVMGLRKEYFEKKSITSRARKLDLKKEEEILTKKERDTPIEKLKGQKPKSTKDFVKEGEKRKASVERMRGEKRMELPERNVSIFKVPYKETKLDKMLAELGKKEKIRYKKVKPYSQNIEDSFIKREAERNQIKLDKDKAVYDKENKKFVDDMLDREAKKKERLIKSGRYTEETYPETKSVDKPIDDFIENKNQILVPPKPIKKSKTKLETPTPEKAEGIAEADTPTTKKKGGQLIVPPLPKEEKRKRPVIESAYSTYEIPLHSDRPQMTPRTMAGSGLSLGTRSLLTSRVGTRSIEGYKQVQPQTVKQSEKLSTKSEQKLFSVQAIKSSQKLSTPQKQSPKLAERTLSRMPTPQKPRAAQKPVFRQKQPNRLALRTPEPMRPRKKIVFLFPPIDLKGKKKGNKGKKSRTTEFLGSSTTDRIVGLFRREGSSDIITGEKRVAKQLKKDIRSKPSSGLGFSGKKLKI